MLFKDHFKTQLDEKIKGCDYCELKAKPVLGCGSSNPIVMLVGVAPGDEESRRGLPFTGITKDLLTKKLEEHKVKKDEYYLTYLIKCPVKNKSSIDPANIRKCSRHLLNEIELLNPRIIYAMGFSVIKFFIDHYELDIKGQKLSDIHGNAYIIPAQPEIKKRGKKLGRSAQPKRYLIPTYDIASDNEMEQMKSADDMFMIRSVDNLGMLLYN